MNKFSIILFYQLQLSHYFPVRKNNGTAEITPQSLRCNIPPPILILKNI
jgi:hypothetical protein